MRFELISKGSRIVVDVENNAGDCIVKLDGREYRVGLERTGGRDELVARVNGRVMNVRLFEEDESAITLEVNDERFTFKRQASKFEHPGRSDRKAPDDSDALKSPMPGRVVSIIAKEGQTIRSGDPLIIMESMKMETILMSDRDGKVKEVAVREGEAVLRGQALIRYAKGGNAP